MKTTIKSLCLFLMLTATLFSCTKVENVVPSATPNSTSAIKKAGCTRQDVVGCDALALEMKRLSGNTCLMFPRLDPPFTCTSPWLYATLYIGPIYGSSPCSSTYTYTIAEQDVFIASLLDGLDTYPWGCTSPRISTYTFTVETHNGKPHLKVVVKYKCCS